MWLGQSCGEGCREQGWLLGAAIWADSLWGRSEILQQFRTGPLLTAQDGKSEQHEHSLISQHYFAWL